MSITEKRMNNLVEVFGAVYTTLYEDEDLEELNAHLIDEWDDYVEEPQNKEDLATFCKARGDVIMSDREVIAYMLLVRMFDISMVCNEYRMEVE